MKALVGEPSNKRWILHSVCREEGKIFTWVPKATVLTLMMLLMISMVVEKSLLLHYIRICSSWVFEAFWLHLGHSLTVCRLSCIQRQWVAVIGQWHDCSQKDWPDTVGYLRTLSTNPELQRFWGCGRTNPGKIQHKTHPAEMMGNSVVLAPSTLSWTPTLC